MILTKCSPICIHIIPRKHKIIMNCSIVAVVVFDVDYVHPASCYCYYCYCYYCYCFCYGYCC